MGPEERYEPWAPVKGWSPGEGNIHWDGTTDRTREFERSLHAQKPGPATIGPKPKPGLTKAEMAGPAASVFRATALFCALMATRFMTALFALVSSVPRSVVLAQCIAWPVAVYSVTRWFVSAARGNNIRPPGHRATIATSGVPPC